MHTQPTGPLVHSSHQREREREIEGERDREREGESGRVCVRASECVCERGRVCGGE